MQCNTKYQDGVTVTTILWRSMQMSVMPVKQGYRDPGYSLETDFRVTTFTAWQTGLCSANLHQGQNLNQKWSGIPMRMSGLSRIRIRTYAESLTKYYAFITLSA